MATGLITKYELSQLLVDYIDAKELKAVPGSMITDGTITETKLDTSVKSKINKVTYTRTETDTAIDARVKALVGAAPAALDTLIELANALGNDPNFAGTVTTSLGNKVDKISGKALSTNDFTAAYKTKLDGIGNGANAYTHPTTHPPSIIAQDVSNRFVTDSEKSAWNGKAPSTVATTSVNGLMDKADKTKLNGIATGANAYSHPANHPASVITQDANNRFVTDSEKSVWNGKAPSTLASPTSNGLMTKEDKSKLDSVSSGSNSYTHPTTHPPSIIAQDSSNKFVTDSEKSVWNGKASSTLATTTANGLMSKDDKSKLDAVANTYQLKVGFNKKTNTVSTATGTVAIGITGFDRAKHLLMVFKNSVYLEEASDYTVSSDNANIVCTTANYKYPVGTIFNFIVVKL